MGLKNYLLLLLALAFPKFALASVCGTGTLLTTYNPFTGKPDYVCVGGTGGGGGSALQVSVGGVQVSSPTSTINFSSNTFTATQSPTGTSNIGINFSSVASLSNLPVPGGANTNVQSKQAGILYGDNGFQYDASASSVTINAIGTNALSLWSQTSGFGSGCFMRFGSGGIINRIFGYDSTDNFSGFSDSAGNRLWGIQRGLFPDRNAMRIYNITASNYVSFRASDTTNTQDYVLPNSTAAVGSVLSINTIQPATGGNEGITTLSWIPQTGGGTASLPLPPGDTNYIQNRSTLQTGTTAYPDFAQVGSSLTVYGQIRSGGAMVPGLGLAAISGVSASTLSNQTLNLSAAGATAIVMNNSATANSHLALRAGTGAGSFIAFQPAVGGANVTVSSMSSEAVYFSTAVQLTRVGSGVLHTVNGTMVTAPVSLSTETVGPLILNSTNSANAITGQYVSVESSVTFSAPVSTVDWNTGNVQYLQLAANTTLNFINPAPGSRYLLILRQTGAGSFTVGFPASVKWPGGTTPTLTTTTNKSDVITFIYDGNTGQYYGGSSLNY